MASASPKRERPLSPHLQVYKPQLTSVLSIVHRLTGVALSAGLLVLVFWLGSLTMGEEFYEASKQFLRSPVCQVLLVGWTFALFYHLANGIRHLFWDIGVGYELSTAYVSGWLVVLAAVVLTALTWVGALS